MAVQSVIQRQFDLQEPLRMVSLQHELTAADSKGDIFNIAITDGGKAADLTGMAVAAYFIRADGATVPITGSVSGNVASVTLTSSCYVKPGRFALVIKVTKGSIRHAVFSAEGVVRRSTTDTLVDDTDVIPSLDELLAKIDTMEKATTAANTATTAANTATSAANTAADKANAAADDIENLQINASTLPTGSDATASYADGVLTLGLPRGEKGEKGDMGSAGPFTVNNVDGVGDNITITGENVPLSSADDTPLSAAVLQRDRAHNILDNSYLISTQVVNQRLWTSGTQVAASRYFLDRWMVGAAIAPTITTAGIKVASGEIYQLLPRSGLVGKTVTAAICLGDGTLIVKNGVVPSDTAWANFINVIVNSTQLMVTNVDASLLRFRIFCNGNDVRWAALYEGAYTAATLPTYQPKGYGAELRECRRYYRRMRGKIVPGVVHGAAGTMFACDVDLYDMRTVPSIADYSVVWVEAGGKSVTSGFTAEISSQGRINLTLTTALPSYEGGVASFDTLILSADYT